MTDSPEPLHSPCYNCKHRRPIPGNAHISCGEVWDGTNPAHALLQIIEASGHPGQIQLRPVRDLEMIPLMHYWPGCGIWPMSYDANIVVTCLMQKEKTP